MTRLHRNTTVNTACLILPREELESLSLELVRRKAEHQEPGLQEQDRREQERREPGRCRGHSRYFYTCPSCGAQIVTDRNHRSDFLLLLP